MKSVLSILLIIFLSCSYQHAGAQCSICTRTAQQMGEKPAKALNTGILYLAAAPILIVGFIGFKWWRSNRGD